MALNVQAGTLTQPGATGNETISLPASFDPKVAFFQTVKRAAPGGGSSHLMYSYGFATDRGGTAAQRYVMMQSEDNIGTSDVYVGTGTADVLVLADGTTGTRDFELSFVEFQSAAMVVNWQNLASVASTQVYYWVLGGSDVEDALVSSFTIANAATTDVTVTAGFGQPTIIFFPLSWHGTDAATLPTANGDTALGFGIKSSSANGRSIRFGSDDGAATQLTNQAAFNNRALQLGNGGAIDTAFQVSADSAWPTDGFEITRNNGTAAFAIPYVAIKLSASASVNHGEAAAATSLNGTNTLTSSGNPTFAFVLGTRTATANAVDSSSTDAMMFQVGFADGSGNERVMGGYDDDAQGTASVAGTFQDNAKGLQLWVPSSNTKDAEADIAVSGSNFVATWTDQAPSGFLYEWLTIGMPAAGGGPTTKTLAALGVG